MTEFSIGDKVVYRPNTKVEPWLLEVLDTPPVERVKREEKVSQNRYELKVLEPAEDTVFLKPKDVKELGYYNPENHVSFGGTQND